MVKNTTIQKQSATQTKQGLLKKKQFLKFTKIGVDVIMLALFIYLMSYRATRGIMLHALFGAALLALFVLHHVLNYRFYKAMFSGKYRFRRILLTICNVLLTIAMLFVAGSSLGLSGVVIDLGIPLKQSSWDLHIVSTAWCFVLMALHLGFHTHSLLKKLVKKTKGTILGYAVYVLFVFCFAFGIFSFVKSELWQDMFLLPTIHSSITLLNLVAEYVGILVLAALIMHTLLSIFSRKQNV